MQKCSKCGQKMVPKIENMEGDVAEILKRLTADTKTMLWSCPRCAIERGAPLKPSEVQEVSDYVRQQKKKWWQFWI